MEVMERTRIYKRWLDQSTLSVFRCQAPAAGCKVIGALLWLTWMGLSLAYIFQAPGPEVEVEQRILSSSNSTFGATTDSLSREELKSRRIFFLSSAAASIFILYLTASLVVWGRTGSFQINLNGFMPCRSCFDCNCLLELFSVPTDGTSKLSCYCGLCAPVTHCCGQRSEKYELSLRAGQPIEMVSVEDAKIFTKTPHLLQTGDEVVYVPPSCSNCAKGPALMDAETGRLLSNDPETSDPILYFVRKVTDHSFALARVKKVASTEFSLSGGGPGHYFVKVMQQDGEPLEEQVSKQLTQMNFQFVRNRRRLTWVCLACYVVAATFVPTLHRSSVSCKNGFYWETHLQFFGVFMAVKLAEVFIYHVDPTITRHPRAWTFLEKFLFSIPGFFDGYTDLTAVFVGYACKDEKDDPMMATRITDMMLTSYILGVVILQWFILPAIAAEDPSNVLLYKIVHMDSLASCSQFPEDFRQRWNILAAARMFAEDIPQAIFQALLIIYVQWNPALLISVGFSVGTTLKAFMDAINHHLQPSQLDEDIQHQLVQQWQERVLERQIHVLEEEIVHVPVQVNGKATKDVPSPATHEVPYAAPAVPADPQPGPFQAPSPAMANGADFRPEVPVYAMPHGNSVDSGPVSPGGPVFPGGYPPAAMPTGMLPGAMPYAPSPAMPSAPDGISDNLYAMDPRTSGGYSVDDWNQHFEPDHLLRAMGCKTMRPPAEDRLAMESMEDQSTKPLVKDDHYGAVPLLDDDSDMLPPQLSWRKVVFKQLATRKTLWTADDAIDPQTRDLLKGHQFGKEMASIFHAFDGKADSGVRKGRLDFTEVQQALCCGSSSNESLSVFRWVLGVKSEAEGQQRLAQILEEKAREAKGGHTLEQPQDPYRQFVSNALSDLQKFIRTVFQVDTISLSIGQWVKLCIHLIVMGSNLKTKMLFHSEEVCKNISGEPNRSICPLLCLGVGVAEVYRARFPLRKVTRVVVPMISFVDKFIDVPVVQRVQKIVEVPELQRMTSRPGPLEA